MNRVSNPKQYFFSNENNHLTKRGKIFNNDIKPLFEKHRHRVRVWRWTHNEMLRIYASTMCWCIFCCISFCHFSSSLIWLAWNNPSEWTTITTKEKMLPSRIYIQNGWNEKKKIQSICTVSVFVLFIVKETFRHINQNVCVSYLFRDWWFER